MSGLTERFRIPRGVECVELAIENAGRVGVTVSEAGISFKTDEQRGGNTWRRWTHQTKHIVPREFDAGEFSTAQEQPRGSLRLDPYSRAVYILDVHSVVDAARESASTRSQHVLRASVTVAGKKRPTRSSWRRRWRVPANAATLVEYGPNMLTESAILLLLARMFSSRGPQPKKETDHLEYVSRLLAAGLWVNRGIADPAQRVENHSSTTAQFETTSARSD